MNPQKQPSPQQIQSHFKKSLQQLFREANVSNTGSISGQEALAFFPKFQLPKQFLKTLWAQTVPPSSTTMNPQQFRKAMALIYQFQTKQSSGGQNNMGGPASGGASNGSQMTPADRQKYEGFFQKLQKNNTVPYQDGIQFFMKSGLDRQTLNSVWQHFDQNRKGHMVKDEFVGAMHAIMMRKRGMNRNNGPNGAPPPPQQQHRPGPPMGYQQQQQASRPAPVMQPQQRSYGSSPSGTSMQQNQNIRQMEARVSHLQEETKNLGKQRFEAERDNSRLTIKLQEMQSREESLQETIQKQRSEIQRLQQERENNQAQIQQHGQNIEQMQMERQQLMNQLTNVKQETFRLESILNNAKMQQSRTQNETQQVVNEIGSGVDRLQSLKDQIESLQNDMQNKEQQQSQAQKDEAERLKQVEEMQQKLHELRKANDDLSSKVLEFETKKHVYTDVSNKVAEQIQAFEKKKAELERRLKECQDKAKTYEAQNEKAQSIRLSHLARTAENVIQNMNDILSNRTAQMSVVPLEEVSALNDFNEAPRLSQKPTENFSSFKQKKSEDTSNAATEAQSNTTKPKTGSANFFDSEDDFGASFPSTSSAAAESNATNQKELETEKSAPAANTAGGFDMDDFLQSSTTTNNTPSNANNGGSNELLDDFFGGSSASASQTNDSSSGKQAQESKAAAAQQGFDDDDWGESDDFGF